MGFVSNGTQLGFILLGLSTMKTSKGLVFKIKAASGQSIPAERWFEKGLTIRVECRQTLSRIFARGGF